jgi:rhodanese-related sulfurtransferase
MFNGPPALSARECLARKDSEGMILVDVRTGEERNESMIPNSIPVDEFEADLEKYSDSTIVVYCATGLRSRAYITHLQRRNLQAFNLSGGIRSWIDAGGTVLSPAEDG